MTSQARNSRNCHRRCSIKKVVLGNFAKFTGKHLCQILFYNKVACNFIIKETLTQVFSSEFCKISKNIFFTEDLQVTASKIACIMRKNNDNSYSGSGKLILYPLNLFNGHQVISASASRHQHSHWHRHSNINIAFYTV